MPRKASQEFRAYGMPTDDIADPITRAIDGLLDQVSRLKARVEQLEGEAAHRAGNGEAETPGTTPAINQSRGSPHAGLLACGSPTRRAADERPVYLDYNATAPLRPAAAEAMARAQAPDRQSILRPQLRPRRRGRRWRRRGSRWRRLAGAKPAQVVFTCGGTEANNLALAGTRPRARSRLRRSSMTPY